MLGQIGRGVRWTYAAFVTGAVIQFVVTAATARLLDPEAFGLIAMANVVLRFGGYVAQMGVGRALIQQSSIDDDDVRAAFTSSTILGVAVATIVIVAAPMAAVYYQTTDVVPVIRWLASTFVLAGLSATAGALLQRQLRFRASGVVEVASYTFGYAVPTLSLAIAGFGVWSLVAGTIGQIVVGGAMAYALTRHTVRPTLSPRIHRRLLGFGTKVSGISFLEFLGSALDVLVIGRFGSPAQLGLYNRAFMLAALPTYRVTNGIARVLFPVLSGGRHDRAAFTQTFLSVTRSAIKVMVPLGVGMALAAPEIVGVVLGETWIDAVPLFSVLAPSLALNVLIMFPGLALESLAILRDKAIVQAAYVVILAACLAGSALMGFALLNVTIVVGSAILLRAAMYFALAVRADIISSSELTSLLITLLALAVATVVAMLPLLMALRTLGTHPVVTLVAAVCAGVAILAVAFGKELMNWWRGSRP
jgi:lipopolysaccharide exporter